MATRLDEMMASRRQIRATRLSQGKAVYPTRTKREHTVAQALLLSHDENVAVAGRIRRERGHGNIFFFDLEDQSGRVQLVAKSDVTGDFEDLSDLQVGDFAAVQGKRFATNSGQESILIESWQLLSKAIRPLPSEWYGLSDEEERYRQRSLDLIMNPEVREVFIKRTKILQAVRRTLDDLGFLEVETPTLQPLYGGANARPFVTHINAWDIPQYLKISDELYLKRLIIGGIDKVYEIDHNFRNEGVDRSHNPEFSMIEVYEAYTDYNRMMELTELMYRNAAIAATGSAVVPWGEHTFDFSQPWRRLPMLQGIQEYLGLDAESLNDNQLRQELHSRKLKVPEPWVRGLAIAELFSAAEENLVQPTFVTDFPRETTSLCKPIPDRPHLIERFEPYIAGMEIGNAYTELNDPILQRQFWLEEREGDPEAHPLDEDFLEAMEFGMPPTGGLGLGIDRMVMLLTGQTKIRDVIFFPTMKSR